MVLLLTDPGAGGQGEMQEEGERSRNEIQDVENHPEDEGFVFL